LTFSFLKPKQLGKNAISQVIYLVSGCCGMPWYTMEKLNIITD